MRFVTHEVPYVAGETYPMCPTKSTAVQNTATFKVALILYTVNGKMSYCNVSQQVGRKTALSGTQSEQLNSRLCFSD